MELLISQHVSNWSHFSFLIETEIPFILENDKLVYLNDIISEEGVKIKNMGEGVWFES